MAIPTSSAVRLLTPRLILDPLDSLDSGEFVAYRRVPSVARWQSWTPDFSEADARALIANQPASALPEPGEWLQLAIRGRFASTLHGDVAIRRLDDQPATFELGVTLSPAAQGRGIATEAMSRVLDHLFADASAHRIVAFCDARNEPVARLLTRIGIRQESRQLEADFFKGEWTTLDGYAILAREHTEFAATPPPC